MVDPLGILEKQLAQNAKYGLCAPLGASATTSKKQNAFHAAMTTNEGELGVNTDAFAVTAFSCGHDHGIAMSIASGNYKDAGCAVASAVVARTMIEIFSERLISEADIVPALRRVMLEGHQSIIDISKTNPTSLKLPTVTGLRRNLRGIGCSVSLAAAYRRSLWSAHIGDTSAFLMRKGGHFNKLNAEHTLEHCPEYRQLLKSVDVDDEDFDIVLKVLGFSEAMPKYDVMRTELAGGDRVILGNLALRRVLPKGFHADLLSKGPSTACRQLKESIHKLDSWFIPATVAILDYEPCRPKSTGTIET